MRMHFPIAAGENRGRGGHPVFSTGIVVVVGGVRDRCGFRLGIVCVCVSQERIRWAHQTTASRGISIL